MIIPASTSLINTNCSPRTFRVESAERLWEWSRSNVVSINQDTRSPVWTWSVSTITRTCSNDTRRATNADNWVVTITSRISCSCEILEIKTKVVRLGMETNRIVVEREICGADIIENITSLRTGTDGVATCGTTRAPLQTRLEAAVGITCLTRIHWKTEVCKKLFWKTPYGWSL